MANKLIIVESPSKAVTIKKYLGEGYKVEASKGHIRDLPKSKLGVDTENDFEPEYINIRGKAELINSLKAAAKKADKVYLATDPDREGEAIAYHLAYILGIPEDEACRVTFNEITKETVKANIKEPRKIDMNLTDAQQARRVMDRIVGYKISPILWKKVRRGLSAGRVQSVAVKLICDREEEIEKFVPEEYWNIYAILSKDNNKFSARFTGANGEKVELHHQDEVDEILKDIKNTKYKVVSVKLGTRKKNPAPPFTTSTLQQEASRKLGFAIRKTMSVAQTLYESGFITYMRTDSTRISESARNAAKEVIVSKYGKEYYENRYYKTPSGAQDGHEGIRPAYVDRSPETVKNQLDDDQFKLYNLIYNRFIASQMSAAVYDTVSAQIDTEKTKLDNVYNFSASGQTLKFKGFMTLYVEDRDDSNDEDDESIIPELTEGETLKKERIDSKQSFTEPPARYTEASLVKELEQKGIGRPSTYATIISTIMDRKYIGKEKKQLIPTDLGKVVNTLLVENFPDIINVEFTADIENQFDSIAEGKEPWKQVIREFYGPFAKELEKVEKEVEHVKLEEQVSNVKCEKCGRLMVVKEGRFGKFLACPGFPDCKNIKPYVKAIDVPCPVCGSEVYERKARRGKCYYICSKNNQKLDDPCVYISWEKPVPGQEWDPTEALENLEKKKKRAAKKTTTKKTTKKAAAKKTTKKTATKKTAAKKTTTKKATEKKETVKKTTAKKTTKKATTTKKTAAKKATTKKTTAKKTTKKSSKK